MGMRTKAWLLGAAAVALLVVSAKPADAAFVDAATALSDTNNVFGQGQGKDQSNVGPSAASDDTLLAFAPFDDTGDPVVFDTGMAPSNADPDTVLDAVNDFLGLNEELVSFTDQDELGRLNVPDDDFQTPPFGGCTDGAGTSCNFDIGEDFGYYVVKYAKIYALFEDGGDNIAHFELGNGNFDTSNLTFITPLPAAAWMMIGGLGMIGGAVARNRRKARADA